VGAASVLARLPIGMTTLALLLLVRGSTGSIAAAGAATACFGLASGAAAPLRGRLVDRLGAAPVLAVTSPAQALALAGLALAAGHAQLGVVLAAAALSGALLPPFGPVSRTLWRDMLAGDDLRQAAYSLDAMALQVLYYSAGPLLVALLSSAGSPALAVWVIAGLTVVGGVLMTASPAARRPPVPYERTHWLGPLAVPAIWGVLVIVVADSAALGAAEVGATAFTASHGAPALSGVTLAMLGVGSIVGGLFQGARTWRSPLRRQYTGWLVVLTAGFVPLPVAPGVAGLAALMAIAGLAVAPVGAVQFGLMGELAPDGTVTEAYTWLLSASLAGGAAGSALGGIAAASGGGRAALGAGVALAGGAVLLSVLTGARPRGFPRAFRTDPYTD
jgi:MFS family permease